MEQIYSCAQLPGMEIPRKAFARSTPRQVAVNPGVCGPVSILCSSQGEVSLSQPLSPGKHKCCCWHWTSQEQQSTSSSWHARELPCHLMFPLSPSPVLSWGPLSLMGRVSILGCSSGTRPFNMQEPVPAARLSCAAQICCL